MFDPVPKFRSSSSLPPTGKFVKHFLVQLSVGLFAEGKEDVAADVLVNYLNFGGVTLETVGIAVNVKRQLLDL